MSIAKAGSQRASRCVIRTAMLLLASVTLLMPAMAQQAAPLDDNKVHFELMPYLVFGGMGGDITIQNRTVDVNASATDVLSNLQFGFMGRTGFSYNRWFAGTDFTYMGLGAANNIADVGVDQWMFEMTGGYRISPYFKVLGGVRYNKISGEFRFQGPLGITRSGAQTWWDPIIGGQAIIPLSKKLSASARFDVGGFGAGSKIAINAEPLLNYNATNRMTLSFGWKFLYQDYKNSSQGFQYDVLAQGPFLGFNFRF